jgi:hypothetical protein
VTHLGKYQDEHSENVDPNAFLKTPSFIVGCALLVLATFGSVLAQSVSLGPSGGTEFGQGYFQVVACDTWIGIQLNPSPSTFSGTSINGDSYTSESRVKSIQISGLDTQRCAGKNIKFTLTNTETSTVLPIFTDVDSLTVSRALLTVNSNAATSRSLALTIIDGNGQNIGSANAYQTLSYASTTSIYTLEFTYPLARMADVTGVNFESSLAA